jgi:predicted RNA binding protein YcfA (HicA-like mRNA interferase family)
MKKYKVRQVISLLRKRGWYILRIRGDHRQFVNDRHPGTVTVIGKESDTLSQELLNSIWKQAGWR